MAGGRPQSTARGIKGPAWMECMSLQVARCAVSTRFDLLLLVLSVVLEDAAWALSTATLETSVRSSREHTPRLSMTSDRGHLYSREHIPSVSRCLGLAWVERPSHCAYAHSVSLAPIPKRDAAELGAIPPSTGRVLRPVSTG